MSESAVRDAVESHTTDYELGRELHRVRPHVTRELVFEGDRAVCKVSTHPEGNACLEGRVLTAVEERTGLPTPDVLAVGDDHFVARWHDWVPQDAPEVTKRRVRAMARGLAALHVETEAWVDSPGLLTHPDSPDKRALAHTADEAWGEALARLVDRRAAYLDGVGYGDVAREVRDWFEERRERFDAVDDPVLVHGNFFGEHVGVDDGAVSAIIDFEHALVGSAGWDYLRTVLPAFGPAADHDVSESVFREAYESVRPLPAGFDRRREGYVTLCLLSYLRSLHLQRANRDPAQSVARRMRAMVRSLEERVAGDRSET